MVMLLRSNAYGIIVINYGMYGLSHMTMLQGSSVKPRAAQPQAHLLRLSEEGHLASPF